MQTATEATNGHAGAVAAPGRKRGIDPALAAKVRGQFWAALRAGLEQKAFAVADGDGFAPEHADHMGWSDESGRMIPGGPLVAWLTEGSLYFDTKAGVEAVKAFAAQCNGYSALLRAPTMRVAAALNAGGDLIVEDRVNVKGAYCLRVYQAKFGGKERAVWKIKSYKARRRLAIPTPDPTAPLPLGFGPPAPEAAGPDPGPEPAGDMVSLKFVDWYGAAHRMAAELARHLASAPVPAVRPEPTVEEFVMARIREGRVPPLKAASTLSRIALRILQEHETGAGNEGTR